MAERDEILIELVREILGPRNGPLESMPADQDPREEYITGVLAPAGTERPPDDIEAELDELPLTSTEADGSNNNTDRLAGEDDQDTAGDLVVPGVLSPALNPKDLPRSIGLTFTVESSDGQPQVEVCATWARYESHPHGQGWQRRPYSILTGLVRADQEQRWKDSTGVSLRLRANEIISGRWRVSLFLVNQTPVAPGQRATTTDHLFQPQIRVHCSPDTFIVPVRTVSEEDSEEANAYTSAGSMSAEDKSLALLYGGRTALARGHLCGATWREIDPERPHPTLPSPAEAPFAWTDADIVPVTERPKFAPSDVRTEMVPLYPIEAPEMAWDTQYGLPPALDPELLAETWQPEQLRNQLQPLVSGYLSWIAGQQTTISGLPVAQQLIAQANLQQCVRASERIQEAIDILVADEEARLAFCFANKAIATQSQWRRQRISWRPFQLAFILLNIPALVDPLHPDRNTCDLLWFPTGGGKTEAYLGLSAFTIALRRRQARSNATGDRTGGGVAVLSRYTLRLLTIQQFRRALGLVTACEYLRVQGLDSPAGVVGWRPHEYPGTGTFLWGGVRFAAGLWVGGNVTPNNLQSLGPIPNPSGSGYTLYLGALDLLQGADWGYNGPNRTLQRNIRSSTKLEKDGEPAQVLNCPACTAALAIPDEGFSSGQHILHFVYSGGRSTVPPLTQLQQPGISVGSANIFQHPTAGYSTLSLTFTLSAGQRLTSRNVDAWWYGTIAPALGQNVSLLAARPARPGYFILTHETNRNTSQQCDFDIYCPNPICILNQGAWAEQVPLSRAMRADPPQGNGQLAVGVRATTDTSTLPPTPNMQWQEVPDTFRRGPTRWVSNRVPIPAYTVDDQVYHRCPSLVIATVDKFARLAFECKASSLFGNVDHYSARWGYYREGCPPAGGGNLPTTYQPHPSGISRGNTLRVGVPPFQPPDLILQDELHLVEGPLGSMVGLYETTVDLLCQRQYREHIVAPKYIASTATVRQAGPQVQALFDRELAQFPPAALLADDRFFAREREVHPLDSTRAGRLYVGVAAPGKGPLTPAVRIWSILLQVAWESWQRNPTPVADHFYTLTGYFNAIRELAGAVALYRQDIPERLQFRFPAAARPLPPERYLELSSRASSLDLPVMLERLQVEAPDAQDVVFTTSMFGTGVDVSRLGLMVVQGQPKTTASYIQATGRVGRMDGGLVVTFLRASRARDLDHYEFFTGYHRALYRYVEPITVAPFAPRARERALGPLAVILLRHARELDGRSVPREWAVQQRLTGTVYSQAPRMESERFAPEVTVIPDLMEARARSQPEGRRPPNDVTSREAASELDLWRSVAVRHQAPGEFVYNESGLTRLPQRHVVLGDAQHQAQGLDQVYENAPQSLRDVEQTTGFES